MCCPSRTARSGWLHNGLPVWNVARARHATSCQVLFALRAHVTLHRGVPWCSQLWSRVKGCRQKPSFCACSSAALLLPSCCACARCVSYLAAASVLSCTALLHTALRSTRWRCGLVLEAVCLIVADMRDAALAAGRVHRSQRSVPCARCAQADCHRDKGRQVLMPSEAQYHVLCRQLLLCAAGASCSGSRHDSLTSRAAADGQLACCRGIRRSEQDSGASSGPGAQSLGGCRPEPAGGDCGARQCTFSSAG